MTSPRDPELVKLIEASERLRWECDLAQEASVAAATRSAELIRESRELIDHLHDVWWQEPEPWTPAPADA